MIDDNPFAAPDVPIHPSEGTWRGVHPGDEETASYDELVAYVGPNTNYYLNKWPTHPSVPVSPIDVGFNGAAFLFAMYWLPYRKMYAKTLVVYAVLIAIELIQGVLAGMVPESDQSIALVSVVSRLALVLTVGWCANAWYLRHCRRKITQLRAQAESEGVARETLLVRLSQRGGTNFWLMLSLLLGFTALRVIDTLLIP